ncbi:MAG: sulfite exporter TauE/SafE family protein [Rhodospirillaceae bacterium]|nr:sulfite exporter TauE/SafE family protein [Rhodospirillaceae bacterium]MBT6119162.1 sulfite exporter TauE/SafE family protein [Rhodospirillaceae bacterium]
MDPLALGIAGAAYFYAAFVKGLTGLGFSTSCIAWLVLAFGLHEALPLLIVPSVASNLMVMAEAGHVRETARRFWPLYLGLLPGLLLGLWLLGHIDPQTGAAILGVVLIGYSLFALARPDIVLAPRLERPLGPPTGFLTGLVNGMTGSQVMPVLPYFMALRLDPSRFVQAINISFTLSSLVMVLGLSRLGLMTWEAAAISTAGIVPVFFGVRLGAKVRRRLSPDQFRLAVLALLAVLGVILIALRVFQT